MKQIDLKVSDDGLFGTPVNEYEKIVPTFVNDIFIEDIINPYWDIFNESHPRLPLTTPQEPNSVVIGELVWQYHNSQRGGWLTVEREPSAIGKSRNNCRQAYQVIDTPKVDGNSELPDIDFNDSNLLNPDNYDDEGNPIKGYYGNSGGEEAVDIAALSFNETHPEMDSWSSFIAGANWQAQQQQVSKSEEVEKILTFLKQRKSFLIQTDSRAFFDVIKEINSLINEFATH